MPSPGHRCPFDDRPQLPDPEAHALYGRSLNNVPAAKEKREKHDRHKTAVLPLITLAELARQKKKHGV